MTSEDSSNHGTSGRDPKRTRRTLELFERSLDVNPSERDAWLDAQCAGDADLRAAVARLLLADAAADNFLDGDYGSSTLRAVIGTSIGPWKLDSLIAEGGMGAVYLAHRDDGAYTQNVAVKLIRPLLLDADAIRRFERERQILAQLQHPNIAQMLDGGTTDNGSPYVVMEFVDGLPITHYCQKHRLGLAQRLDLFRGVCSAVQAAHRSLIVHRDLKPGNILVTADGVPKLLDFGIAKILQSEQSEVTQVAATTITLTPDYASPEQVRNQPITTSSDVYSLGVVLYEMLAEQRPYALSDVSAVQAEQLICERNPPSPSEALSKSVRGRETKYRARDLRGDLDTIIMMALRKEPERRYGSVQELSEDIQRYLRGLPISARRDSRIYRIAKFTGRHRWGMVAASLLVVSMLAGIVATTWQAKRAEQQAQRAEQQAARAEKQQVKAEKIGEFFRNILMSSSSQWMSKIRKGPDATMAEVLEISAERADVELVDQPEIHADVLDTISQSLQGMGLYEKARDIALKATQIADAKLAADHPLRATTHYHYAMSLNLKGEFESAEREFKLAIDLGTRILPPDAEIMPFMHNDYFVFLATLSRNDEALRELELAIELQRRRTKSDANIPIAVGIGNLGVLKIALGDLDGAIRALNESLGIFAKFPDQKFAEVAVTLHNRSRAYKFLGRETEARDDAHEAVRVAKETVGVDHVTYAAMLMRRAEVETDVGNIIGAKADLESSQTVLARHISAPHPLYTRLQIGIASLDLAKDFPEKAEAALEIAISDLEDRASTESGPDYILANALRVQGMAVLKLRHPQRAHELLKRSLDMYRELFGPDVYVTRQTHADLDRATAAVDAAQSRQ